MAIKTPVDTRLAIEGGTPVRSADDPLPGIFPRDVPQESYDNIREVLEKGLTSGYLRRFEQEFAEVNGAKYCVALANCTATLAHHHCGDGHWAGQRSHCESHYGPRFCGGHHGARRDSHLS